jgi:hypothetical protein
LDGWDDNDLDAIEDLMSETPSGEVGNHGSQATRSSEEGSPGSKRSKSLDPEMLSNVQWVAEGGATTVDAKEEGRYHGLVTHQLASDSTRTLTRRERDSMDAAKVRADVLARLGFTEDDMTHLDKPGAPTPYGRALRERFDARLLEVTDSGAAQSDLALALGWPLYGSASPRMQKALERAKDRRAAGGPAVQAAPPPPVAREAGAKCLCGCDRETPLAPRTRNGNVKGHPLRYLPGHNRRYRQPQQ